MLKAALTRNKLMFMRFFSRTRKDQIAKRRIRKRDGLQSETPDQGMFSPRTNHLAGDNSLMTEYDDK